MTEILTTRAVAERFGVVPSTVVRWVDAGRLVPFEKTPGLRGSVPVRPGGSGPVRRHPHRPCDALTGPSCHPSAAAPGAVGGCGSSTSTGANTCITLWARHGVSSTTEDREKDA